MSPKSAQQKKVNKIVSDKTFGLKNKNKSKKVQEYVSGVKSAAKNAGRPRSDVVAEEARRREREAVKKAKADQEMEMKALFKTVVDTKQQPVPAGVDPRTVVCAYFKAGKCVRGQKCKFSHNVEQERKTTKISLYVDPREQEKDTIDKWDQAKLEAVVESKYKRPTNETKIVCKHFLDAIEKLKYGWFWECPTDKRAREEHLPVGCIYKHALPPGFVFQPKVDKKIEEMQEEDTALALMESIEEERKQLDLSKCQPVTLESFTKWKADKKKKKEAEVEAKRKEEAKKTGGKGLGVLSGRDLFKYDPSLFVDDADAVDDKEYQIEDKDETQEQMQTRLEAEAQAEEEEMKRRAQFEARAELYRNDASADATNATGIVADAQVGGTTTAIAFALPASLMAKAKPTNVGDASLFDDDEAVDADADGDDAGDGDGDGDADADGDAADGGDGGDGGEGEAAADGGEGEAAADGGEGEAAAADGAADADAGGDADAAAADADADADADAGAEDADAAAAKDTKSADATDAKAAPAAGAGAAAAAAPKADSAKAGAAKPAAAAVVGDASLFDEDLDDLPDV